MVQDGQAALNPREVMWRELRSVRERIGIFQEALAVELARAEQLIHTLEREELHHAETTKT